MTTVDIGIAILLVGLLVVAAALTIGSFMVKSMTGRTMLVLLGIGVVAMFAWQCVSLSSFPATGVWDFYWIGALVALVGWVIAGILSLFIGREKRQDQQALADEDAMLPDGERFEQEWDNLAIQTRIPRLGSRHVNRRTMARRRKPGPQYG